MASRGTTTPASGRESPFSDDPAPCSSGKRPRTDDGSNDGRHNDSACEGTYEDGSAAKTYLDILVENWSNLHAHLESRDVVRCSRTCRRLHELCVDEDGKARVNEIAWRGVASKGNFDTLYQMVKSVRFDGVKTISLQVRLMFTAQQMSMIFNVLSSPRDHFPLLEKLELYGGESVPDGQEMMFADLGSKLAKHSPALRILDINDKAFSRTAYRLVKPILKKNLLTHLELYDDVSASQQDLIDDSQAKEMAELIISSTSLEHLTIGFDSDGEVEGGERVSLWFKTKLVPAIRAGLDKGGISPNQSRLRHLWLETSSDPDDDVSRFLSKEELELLFNHFSGPHLSDLTLYGNWMKTESGITTDVIDQVVSRSPLLTKVHFRHMHDSEGRLWAALARFVSQKMSSCQVTYIPCSYKDRRFYQGLKKGAESMIPLLKGRDGGSKWDTTLHNRLCGSDGWILRVDEVLQQNRNAES